ncbi:MAG: nuclear transport factor 2 family protein [Opitutales bacterium]
MKKLLYTITALSLVVSAFAETKVIDSHFLPTKSHLSTLQIQNREAIDTVLVELNNIKVSGAKDILSSHGAIASQEEVEFQIAYLNKLKTFLTKTCDAGELGQMLLGAYPHLDGYENVAALTEALLPTKACPVKEEVRAAMNKYFKSVTACDANLIKEVWADEKASLINGRGHYFNEEDVINFMTKAFADANNAVLSSISEHIVLLGEDTALVRLYWMWTEAGKKTGRGRESLIFNKIDGKWKLVHVHYSPLPKAN